MREDHLPSILLKIVHDALNRQGVTVSNRVGHRWTAYGDGHLAKSGEALAMALEAVRRSREELELAAQTGKVPTLFAAEWLIPDQVEVALPPMTPPLAGVRMEPQMIAMPLTDFAASSGIFRSLLEAVLLKKGPENPLYQLVKGNAGLAGLKLEEWVRWLVGGVHRAGDVTFILLDLAAHGAL